jgi:hypothetical protein
MEDKEVIAFSSKTKLTGVGHVIQADLKVENRVKKIF